MSDTKNTSSSGQTIFTHVLSVAAFVVVSFAVQGLSHFVINRDHFSAIGFLRSEPIVMIGIAVMVAQGTILSLVMSHLSRDRPTIGKGILVSGAFGGFLALYIALVEPSKYTVPSIENWVVIEGLASAIQFTAFGFLLGLIHTKLER